MIEAEDFPLDVAHANRLMVASIEDTGVAFGEASVEGDFSDIVEEAADECLSACSGPAGSFGDQFRRTTDGNAVFPQSTATRGRGFILAACGQRFEELDGQGGVANRTKAEKRNRASDGHPLVSEAEVGATDHFQNAGRE
jgi:hypothetical protein